VNCEVCGTELPHGALFCGECGRAVGTRTARTVNPDSGMPIHGADTTTPDGSDAQPANELAERSAERPAMQRDTAIIEPVVRDRLPELENELPELENELPEHPDAPDSDGLPEAIEPAAGEADAAETPEQDDVEQDLPPEVVAEEAAESAAEPESEPVARSAIAALIGRSSRGSDSGSSLPSRPDPFPWGDRGSAIFSDSDELEQTLIVPRRETGERFVLQFSTGESVTVFGSGLLGRNPIPQPTEYYDQLVSISDPGKSVSKTHLEFGQEGGSFWVSDRFSGNGSAVREPESSLRRLVAGKRYRIVRGTRVDIGEQFFVVS
jgi:hypothetical protein